MARELRRSKRTITIRKDPAFIYEEEYVNSVFKSNTEIEVNWQPRRCVEVENSLVPYSEAIQANNVSDSTDAILLETWSELQNLPTYFNTEYYSLNNCNNELAINSSLSQSGYPNTREYECEGVVGGVTYENNTSAYGDSRKSSSTRFDFIDNNRFPFLSVSSLAHSSTSDMGSENERGVLNKNVCSCGPGASALCTKCSSSSADPLMNLMDVMLGKLDSITRDVSSLKVGQCTINNRIQRLEHENDESTASDAGASSAGHSVAKARSPKDRLTKSKNKTKSDAVAIEKERQYQVLLEQILHRDREGGSSTWGNSQESPAEVESSDTSQKKKKKKKKQRRSKGSSSGRKSAPRYPDNDPSESEDPESSEKESDGDQCCKGRRKVKSGAEVKKRPVLKTELWPHTLANEEEGHGDEVTSDNIKLSTFNKYFTKIIIKTKDKTEAIGRTALLHAISSILECLPWVEARNFHNLTMVKIEQKRLEWKADFAALGEEYLDRKVRLNLRTKGTSAGSNDSYKSYGRSSNSANFNPNRSYNDVNKVNSNRFSNDFNRYKLSLICHQFNAGACSYGDNCKRWHTCKSCATAGKIGEKHKAYSQDCPYNKFKQSNQQV